MKKSVFYLFFFLVPVFIPTGCGSNLTDEDKALETIYHYTPPADLQDGVSVSTLEEEGMSDVPIRIMMDSINGGSFGSFHSLLILKNSKLVFEEYFNGWGPSDLHPMWSVTKSITSAVTGIAVEQGKISSVRETIYHLLSGHERIQWSDAHKLITLENYLTMTAGYKWGDMDNSVSMDDPGNSYIQMLNSGDWIRYVLELPLAVEPGTKFWYNNGTSTMLSVIVSDAVEENFDTFADNHLFSKIGISNYYWAYMPGGYPGTAGNDGGVFLTPRDMSKFGLLYLNQGRWNDEQVINEGWVATSTSAHIDIKKNESIHFSYGYQWWRNEKLKIKGGKEIAVPYAVGHGGQYIFLIMDYDLLVVITSPSENTERTTPETFDMISEYILPSIE